MAEQSLSVIVLAGPNGAGKTTAARALLAESLQLTTFVITSARKILNHGLHG